MTRRRLLRLVDIAELLGVSKQRADQQRAPEWRAGWEIRNGLWETELEWFSRRLGPERGRRMTDSQAVYLRAGGT